MANLDRKTILCMREEFLVAQVKRRRFADDAASMVLKALLQDWLVDNSLEIQEIEDELEVEELEDSLRGHF